MNQNRGNKSRLSPWWHSLEHEQDAESTADWSATIHSYDWPSRAHDATNFWVTEIATKEIDGVHEAWVMEFAIKKACRLPPVKAIRIIAKIWESAEQVCALAAARSRISLEQVVGPPCVNFSLPVGENGPVLSRELTEAAEKLIGVVLNTQWGKGLELELEVTPVEISIYWKSADWTIQWDLESVNLNWPGCKVRVLVLKPSGIETRILYNAFDVVEHLQECVSNAQSTCRLPMESTDFCAWHDGKFRKLLS